MEGLPLRAAALVAATAIRTLAQDVRIPTLGRIGVREENLEKLSTEAFSVRRLMDNNPRILTVDDVKGIYRDSL